MNEVSAISILIVDDAAFSRRMLRKYLTVEGYQIFEAANGQQALDTVKQHSPDCILTDLLMPDMDGFQFIQAIREQGLTLPIAIITADVQDAARQRGEELGVFSFINKPVKEEQVRQTIRHLLQQEGATPDAANH